MKQIKILLFLLIPLVGFSQIQGEDEVYLSGERIDAKFNGGGLDRFYEFITKEFDYSKVSKAGKLEALFTIDEEGNLTKIRITQVLDVESAAEFIRVLKKSPKWEPAKRNGKPISIEIRYPMVFHEKKAKKPENLTNVSKPTPSDSNNEKIYETASIEKKPEYPGGMMEFYKYIGKKYRTPDVKGLQGKVVVSFVIEKDGTVTDIKIIKDIGHGTGDEAIRVLQNCEKWIPGEQNGEKVRVLYTLPITIKAS